MKLVTGIHYHVHMTLTTFLRSPVQRSRQCFIQLFNTWGEIMKVGEHMVSAKREPIMGSGGRAPSEVHVQSSCLRPPPEAESLVACGRPIETAKLLHFLYFANSIHTGLLCIFDVFRKTTMATFEVAST